MFKRKGQNSKKFYLFLTLLILVVVASFAGFVPSRAKYFSQKEGALGFSTGVYKLYKENQIALSKPNYQASTEEVMQLSFTFPRNEIGDFQHEDVYEVVIPKCQKITLTSLGKVKNNTVTYSDGNQNTTKAALSCNVEDLLVEDEYGHVWINFDVSIYEKVDEEEKFLYTTQNFRLSHSVYLANIYKKKPNEVSNILSIPANDGNFYQTFMNWITAYSQGTNSKDTILSFVKSMVIEGNKESVQQLKLPGIRVEYDEDNDAYVYSISENLENYANAYTKTLFSFQFFKTKDKEELEFAFEYYLNKMYLKNYSSADAKRLSDLVITYVKSFDGTGVSYMIFPDSQGNLREIPGITSVNETDTNMMYSMVSDTIFDYAYNKQRHQVRISFGTRAGMMNVFLKSLPMVYSEEVISKETIDSFIKTYPSLIYAVVRNNNDTNPTKQSFSEYFLVEDKKDGHPILLNLYSNVGEDTNDPYNYVIASKIDYDHFTFTDNHKSFRVNAKDKAAILKFVHALDVLYGVEREIKDTDITEKDANGCYSFLYTTPEVILEEN